MGKLRILMSILLLLTLAACLPAPEEKPLQPVVALVNAPADQRVGTVADALQEEIARMEDCCPFSFTRTQPVRFQETHRNMYGSRAPVSSAALARNLGAELAVMASAPRFERTVEESSAGTWVHGTVQLRAVVLSADRGDSLGGVGSLVFRARRPVGEDEALPDIEDDPTMSALVEEAAADLAPHLAAVLSDLAREFRQRK